MDRPERRAMRCWVKFGIGVPSKAVDRSRMLVGYTSKRVHSRSTGMSPRPRGLLSLDSTVTLSIYHRSRYVILSGGYLITFKIKKKQAFHERKKVFSLFGSYCYSGQMAHDELHDQADQDAFARHPRVYHDGLQVSPSPRFAFGVTFD